jgi:hypothetical protein
MRVGRGESFDTIYPPDPVLSTPVQASITELPRAR